MYVPIRVCILETQIVIAIIACGTRSYEPCFFIIIREGNSEINKLLNQFNDKKVFARSDFDGKNFRQALS